MTVLWLALSLLVGCGGETATDGAAAGAECDLALDNLEDKTFLYLEAKPDQTYVDNPMARVKFQKGEEGLEVVMDAEERMAKSVASMQDKLMTLRVGRASPSMLDRVEVDYYDVATPLNQLGSITVSGSNQLVISVYDTSCLGDVEPYP